MNPEEIKYLIMHSSEPFVIKNSLKWNILNWKLSDWEALMKNEEMEFRTGNFQKTKEPQWERKTKQVKYTFRDFLEQAESSTKENWLYFDYKYLNSYLLSASDMRKELTWAALGFPEINPDDCTIWIGSKGSHTPCHVDTYGFNLIHQIYGRKLWILFPPEENLKPTRIPYEESSIYSELNFFGPSTKDFERVSNCRKIILEPGDVLYLPHQWWHYVENLDTAISINVWLPLPEDDEERIKEALTQFFVKQICNLSNPETNDFILNPNMKEVLNEDTGAILDILMKCKDLHNNKLDSGTKRMKLESRSTNPENENTLSLDDITKKCNINRIPKMSNLEFMQFLEEQNEKFESNSTYMEPETEKERILIQDDRTGLLRVLTDIDVISLIKTKLINQQH